MNVRFACPACECPARLETPLPSDWQCPACDHRLHPLDPLTDPTLPLCVLCGNRELYRKKDFPHGLGLTILTVACLASVVSHWLYRPWLTWTILIGSAAFDGLLYLWVGDVTVCYRCGAHYRGVPAAAAAHPPFELGIGERYRQEKLRREQFQAEKKAGA